jgi:hypothetical protein
VTSLASSAHKKWRAICSNRANERIRSKVDPNRAMRRKRHSGQITRMSDVELDASFLFQEGFALCPGHESDRHWLLLQVIS